MGRQLIHPGQRLVVAQNQAGGTAKSQRHPLPQRPASPPHLQRPQSPTHSTHGRPNHQQQQQHGQAKPVSINTQPSVREYHSDTNFVTGAWIFDHSRVPQWMAPHLPQHCVSPTHFSRIQAPLSPKGNRTMSPRLPSPKMSLGLPMTTSSRPSSPTQSSTSPTLQFGDDPFLWNEWSQWSGKPLWANGHENPSPLAKVASHVSPVQAGQKNQQQRRKNAKR